MLNIQKDVQTNVSLDVLKLIDAVALSVIKIADNSFYSNGTLWESNAIKNLNSIRGQMLVLRNIVDNTK